MPAHDRRDSRGGQPTWHSTRRSLFNESSTIGGMTMMTRCTLQEIVTAGLLAVLGLASSAFGQETAIKLDQVPKAVMDAAKAKFPGAVIQEASKETEGGKTVFELEMKHQGRALDVTFQENGTLDLVEATITEKDIPSAVLNAVKGKYPGAKITLVESVTKGAQVKKDADSYEFHLTTSAQKSIELQVDPKGKILEAEEGTKTGKGKD
jgi:hypothetical protein